jgi:lipid-binding SYLF domain-containing protein
MKRFCIVILTSVILTSLALFPAASPARAADTAANAQEIVRRAGVILDKFTSDKDMQFFHENLRKAKGVLILPEVLKAGFFWGGSGGTGVLVIRDEKSNDWSQPAFYIVGSVTFGLQIGAESAEVIMLAMSRKAVDSLLASSFKLGGDISVAAGPTGAGLKKVVTADFISFAKAKGLYAGLDFEGSVIKTADDLNKVYYGREVRPMQILMQKEVTSPHSEILLGKLPR